MEPNKWGKLRLLSKIKILHFESDSMANEPILGRYEKRQIGDLKPVKGRKKR